VAFATFKYKIYLVLKSHYARKIFLLDGIVCSFKGEIKYSRPSDVDR